MHEIEIKTKQNVEFIEIANRVQDIINKERIKDGVGYLFITHTTAGLTINENADPSVAQDIQMALNQLFDNMSFQHIEGNSPAHIKASLLGNSLNLIIEKGKIVLGTWQGIFLTEFDGPRTRKVYLKFIPAG
ncbi:secondary thiamine-phosphate synthase enzyme YjbQ [[Eubacterium] cellulosolvens]